MTNEEHAARHRKLHTSLDELAADYIRHTGRLPSETTVMELLAWSNEQTKSPCNNETFNHVCLEEVPA